MTPIEQAKMVYLNDPECNRVFEADLAEYLKNGYVWSSPTEFIMARPTHDAWFVHLAAGKGALRRFLDLMPFELPFLEWERKGKCFRRWSLERVRRKFTNG